MRVDFAKPRKGRQQQKGFRMFLYGPEKVGKSSFIAEAPAPIFFDPTGGTDELDVSRVPEPEDGSPFVWADILDLARWISTAKHKYQTLVFDEFGTVEALAQAHCARRNNKRHIADIDFQRGYEFVLDDWRELLSLLEPARSKGINVAFLAHSHVKTFKNPEGVDYDRYQPLIHPKLSGLLKQWCDCIFFARFEEMVVAIDKKGREQRGWSSGERKLHTVRRAAFDAGNRYNLPETMSLDWGEFIANKERGAPQTAEESIAELRALAEEIGGEVATKITSAIERCKGDAAKLWHVAAWAKVQKQHSNEEQ